MSNLAIDNSKLNRAQFHNFGRDYIKNNQLNIALEVVVHAPLLQPNIGISGCSIYVIEQKML